MAVGRHASSFGAARGGGEAADEPGLLRRHPEATPAYLLVPCSEGPDHSEGIVRVGGCPAVHLVERPFAEDRDEVHPRGPHHPFEKVEVDEAAALGGVEG